MSKKFVLNADDFGMSHAYNMAILDGFQGGILKSASLVANGDAFEEAVNTIIPQCEGLGVGVHLNIIEGQALSDNVPALVDENGFFNNSFVNLLVKSYSSNSSEFLADVEKEFRAQIEKIISKTHVSHIDSHVHVHSIPRIFNIVCKLAKEYGISQVRTQTEHPYIIPSLRKHLTLKYPINLIKVILLNTFTHINHSTVRKYRLRTNDYLIGVSYTSMMDSDSVYYGLSAIKHCFVTEALIHPCKYDNETSDNHSVEYSITKDNTLKQRIEQLGFKITNYVKEM